jgi:hypothetical protein
MYCRDGGASAIGSPSALPVCALQETTGTGRGYLAFVENLLTRHEDMPDPNRVVVRVGEGGAENTNECEEALGTEHRQLELDQRGWSGAMVGQLQKAAKGTTDF